MKAVRYKWTVTRRDTGKVVARGVGSTEARARDRMTHYATVHALDGPVDVALIKETHTVEISRVARFTMGDL